MRGESEGKPQASRQPFRLSERAKEGQGPFLRFPAPGVDGLVLIPGMRIEMVEHARDKLAGLAPNGAAQGSRTACEVRFVRTSADRQDMVGIADRAMDAPSGVVKGGLQPGCAAILVRHSAQGDPVRAVPEIPGKRRQRRAVRHDGTEAERVPVGETGQMSPASGQRQNRKAAPRPCYGEQRGDAAMDRQALPPGEAVKRRLCKGCGQKRSKRLVGLHFVKIRVIVDLQFVHSPRGAFPQMPGRPEYTILPLDYLVLRGADADEALVLRKETLTWKDLRTRVSRLAAWLAREVPEKGARVATWAAKGEMTCLMPLAAARAGLVHVPINPLLKHAQVAHILGDSGAALLLGTPARLATLEAVRDVPRACRVVAEDVAMTAAAAFEGHLGASTADPNDLAAILYTSGSTGRPKGVMLSHANMWLGAESVADYLGLASDDRTLAVLPLSFDYGQNQLLSTWYAGGCVVPIDYLVPRDLLKAVERHGITTLAAVPPLWVQVTELDWPPEVAGRLRRVTNSGGALTVDLVRKLRSTFPSARLFPMYGLTEAFRSTYLDPALVDVHPTSMGKAIPHAEVLVINDMGRIAEDDEEGELVHCGPLVAQGYWQDPERTAERYRPAPPASRYGGTAVWSGDRVRRARDGLLYFVGRRDAMIKSAGNRISPQEIEEAALATGLVAEAVALGVPDDRLGQAVHLVVRAAADASDAASELPRKLMQNLPNFMQPKIIHWRERLPTGPNGKLDRVVLAAELDGGLKA